MATLALSVGTVGYLTDRTKHSGKSYISSDGRFVYLGASNGVGTVHHIFASENGGYKISVPDRDFTGGFYSFDSERVERSTKISTTGRFRHDPATIKRVPSPVFVVGKTCRSRIGKS